jgi:hypothetical protein
MTTESEIKLARYSAVEREADAFGRVIGVRRLRPSEQARLTGMTDDMTGFDETDAVDDVTGEMTKFNIPHRAPFLISAAVCEIDQVKIPFPRSRSELDSIYDRLDVEGISAAARAFAKLTKVEGGIVPLDEAKNSLRTESLS